MMTPDLLKIVINQANAMYLLALIGNTPRSKQMVQMMDNPRPGDLVYEVSTGTPRAVGYLICKRNEFVPWEEEAANEPPGGYFDNFWYIRGLSGEFMRWYNCEFRRTLETSIYSLEDSDEPRTEWAKALEEHYLKGK